MPGWVHHIIVKALAIIPALYCIQSAGAEGIYQLLLYCQIVLAILLPLSVIPLFRVSSSSWIMGAFKISWHLEIFALAAFLGMLAPSIVFTLGMLFGNSSWIIDLRGNMWTGVTLPYTLLLLLAFASLGFTLYLAVTPLRSASDGPDMQIRKLRKDLTEQSGSREEIDSAKIIYEKDQYTLAEIIPEEFLECLSDSDNLIMEPNLDPPKTITASEYGGHKSALSSTPIAAYISPAFHADEAGTTIDNGLLETLDEASTCWFEKMGISERIGTKDSAKKVVAMAANVHKERDDGHGGASKTLKSSSTSSTSEVPETSKNVRVKTASDTNGKVGLSGLSRGGRCQFAAILNEFWGHMFDFHGKLTDEAKIKRVDILLGLDLETASMSAKPENAVNESSRKSSPVYPTASRDYSTPVQLTIPSADSPYVMQTRTPSLPVNMQLVDAQSLNQCNGQESRVIHGCEIPSNDRATSSDRNFVDQLRSPNFAESSGINYGDQFTHTLGQNGFDSSFTSGLQNPAAYGSSRLRFGSLYNEPSLAGTMSSLGYTKKYHCLPDVSELNFTSRNSSLNDESGQHSDPLCSRPALNRMKYEQLLYPNIISTAEEFPLEFDEYFPSEHHKGVFSEPMNLNLYPESLWARPYEQSFTTMIKAKNQGDNGVTNKPGAAKKFFSYAESEAMILWSLRVCIMKLLKLEASDWLFSQNGGCDEELIDRIAISERILLEEGINKVDQMSEVEDLTNFPSLIPDCGDSCIWQATLIVSFGVWCVHRIIELLLVESRPELWGKFTYVLNRLQGILEPAFFKPRSRLISCKCLAPPEMHENGFQHDKRSTGRGHNTTASLIVEIIKNAEAAISGRKGRTGTAAGNIAFPKGKENVASVLKRYKRRLSNKSSGSNVGSSFSSRKGPLRAP